MLSPLETRSSQSRPSPCWGVMRGEIRLSKRISINRRRETRRGRRASRDFIKSPTGRGGGTFGHPAISKNRRRVENGCGGRGPHPEGGPGGADGRRSVQGNHRDGRREQSERFL